MATLSSALPHTSVITNGLSSPAEVERDLVGLHDLLARERAWYAETPRLHDDDALFGAIATGALVRVEADANILPVGRFLNPAHMRTFPPYLTPGALNCMQTFGKEFRSEADKLGLPNFILAAATSFIRTQERQIKIVEAGKLAVLDSTHPTGNAFDIDRGGYYIALPDRTLVAVSRRSPAQQEPIASALKAASGRKGAYDPIRLGPEFFDHRVTDALMRAAATMHNRNLINAVPEMVTSTNTVLHIAAAPTWESDIITHIMKRTVAFAALTSLILLAH